MLGKSCMFLILALSISACAGMADGMSKAAGLGVIDQQIATFDNSTIITVSPNFLPDNAQTKLGARWSSATPTSADLILSYGSNASGYSKAYISFSGLDLKIDGETQKFKSAEPTKNDTSAYNPVSRTIYTSSMSTVTVPYDVIEKMLHATDCRIRIYTSEGIEDVRFSGERDPAGRSTAVISLRAFAARVAAVKSAK
jgi:ABC-type glycerol-3-phosphate transport system substrate-binding protein